MEKITCSFVAVVVARTLPQARKGRCQVAVVRYVEYLHTHNSFRVKFINERRKNERKKKRKKEEERKKERKKEERQKERKKERKMNKIEIFAHDFLERNKG